MTTQFANASYQEIIDLHTESTSVSIVGIHTPCSDTPYKMLKGFWDQFKKFKYNGCSITMVPSATLPVDPLQVSYDASEPTIDPRDTLNPIMFHGCHGDDMGAILNSLYSDPVSGAGQFTEAELSDSVDHNKIMTGSGSSRVAIRDLYEALYYRALTDKTWLKAHPQRGFKKTGLHPMIYDVASTVQLGNVPHGNLLPNGIVHDDETGNSSVGHTGVFGSVGAAGIYENGSFGRPVLVPNGDNTFSVRLPNVYDAGSFVTPRLRRLGWMDTRQVLGRPDNPGNLDVPVESPMSSSTLVDALANAYKQANDYVKPVLTPKIFMGMIMLPPAYKTMQHFRLILNHSYSFAKFRGASMQYDTLGEIKQAYPYFNFSGYEESKRDVDPQPEPEPEPKKEVDSDE